MTYCVAIMCLYLCLQISLTEVVSRPRMSGNTWVKYPQGCDLPGPLGCMDVANDKAVFWGWRVFTHLMNINKVMTYTWRTGWCSVICILSGKVANGSLILTLREQYGLWGGNGVLMWLHGLLFWVVGALSQLSRQYPGLDRLAVRGKCWTLHSVFIL